MNGEGWGLLLLLRGCGLSVSAYRSVRSTMRRRQAIKRILMAVNDLEE